MHRLIEFIKRVYIVLLFLLIEGIAVWSYATATPYTESKILARTSAVGSAISGTITDARNFVSLPEQNKLLTQRVAELEEELQRRDAALNELVTESSRKPIIDSMDAKFCFHPASVVAMTTNRRYNYIVLDIGEDSGIRKDMGVITPNREFVGTVVSCSKDYCVVMPLLNTRFKIGGRMVDSDYVCSIYWDGTSRYEVTAVELSKYAEPRKGMVINAESDRLPLDVKIGEIKSSEINASKSAYSVELTIAAEMQNLSNVLVVENKDQQQIDELVSLFEN